MNQATIQQVSDTTASDTAIDTHMGPWHTAAQVGQLLHISATEVDRLCARRQLLGIRYGDGNHYYPTRQIDQDHIVEGLQPVLDTLVALDASMETAAVWLAGPLHDTPAAMSVQPTMWDGLRAGMVGYVLERAERDVRHIQGP